MEPSESRGILFVRLQPIPQKEIGKYIKILGEALQLCHPLNNSSISVHMPRFCTLLQLNKSAQDLRNINRKRHVERQLLLRECRNLCCNLAQFYIRSHNTS